MTKAKLDAGEDWRELTTRWIDASGRFALAGGLAAAQQARLDREAERYSAGRTLMLQVLSAEDDVANARMLRLRTAFERLALAARSRLWGPS